jgi:hypothetical protein
LILTGAGEIIADVMKLMRIIFCGLLLSACSAPGQVGVNRPQGKPASYPPVIEDSAARQQAVLEAWKSLLSESGLPDAPLDLEPVLNTPRALPGELAGRIIVSKKGNASGEIELKEALRTFIERNRGLLSGDPKESQITLQNLSLTSFANEGNFYRAVYRQVTYPFPIVDGYGELRLTVSKSGMLLQWNSRIIPTVSLPTKAEIKPDELAEKPLNREFTYTSIAGQRQSFRATKRDEIVVRDLVVYPKQEGSKISIHLAYAVEVGSGMKWTVYYDSIDGRELGVKQNFAS